MKFKFKEGQWIEALPGTLPGKGGGKGQIKRSFTEGDYRYYTIHWITGYKSDSSGRHIDRNYRSDREKNRNMILEDILG